MTKAELIKVLELYEDDAEIEVSLPTKVVTEALYVGDITWWSIREVESVSAHRQEKLKGKKQHCLLFLGKMTMG